MTNIEFLKEILNKQFELVGCGKTTDEVIAMGPEQQAEFWGSYKITKEQIEEWRKYFMELSSENDEFKVYEQEEQFQDILNVIFDTLVDEWAFEIIEKPKRGRKKKSVTVED